MRFHQIARIVLTAAATTLVGGVVLAQATPDPVQTKIQERQALGVEFDRDLATGLAGSPTAITVTGTLGAMSPRYNRIFTSDVDEACGATSSDSANDGVSWFAVKIAVTVDEVFEAEVVDGATTVTDTVLSLYCAPFDPSNPAANLVAYDDDDGPGLLSAFGSSDDIMLTAGQDYFLVLSTFSPGDGGDFELNLTGATVFEVPVEVQSFTVD